MPRTRSGICIVSGRDRSTWKPASRGVLRFFRSTDRTTRSDPWEASPMSLSTAIAAELDARPDQIGTVSAQDGPDLLELDVSANAPVGVMLEHLDFAVSDPSKSEWTIDELQNWGDRI